MKRREFLRGLLIASVAVGVSPLVPAGEKAPDVLTALKSQIEGNKFQPQSVLLNPDTLVKYFKISKEAIEDEELFNELMDEAGVPDQKPDEVKIGYDGSDFADGILTVVLKYKAV